MKNLGEFDAGVDRGHSCARCRRCQVILDENNCAESLIPIYASLVVWRSGLEARGKRGRRGVEMQLIRIVLLVGSTPLIGLRILLVL